MDDYDSDSSVSDVGSGTTTNILLGYATKEAVDETFSRLGGEPTWYDSNEPPPAQLAKCKNCSSFMALLLQLNGNLPSRFPGHERSLYLWACRKKTCRRKEGSVRAFRCTKSSKQAQQATVYSEDSSKVQLKNQGSNVQVQKKTQDLGSSLFGVKPFSSKNPFSNSTKESSQASNPFSTGAEPTSAPAAKPTQSLEADASELAQTFAQKARLSSPAPNSFPATQAAQPESEPEPWPAISEFQKPYPLYYLDAEYEYLSPTSDEASKGQQSGSGDNKMYESLMDTESSSSSKGKEEAAYESAHDKTFQHFADTVSQNPEQVLRYEFGGIPLLYSRSDGIGNLLGASIPNSSVAAETKAKVTTNRAAGILGIPNCPNCNSARVFELQLTPHAIAELEAEEEAATLLGEGMEWGTVIMAVCSEDCNKGVNKTTYREEWVGVQWEEVVERPARRSR